MWAVNTDGNGTFTRPSLGQWNTVLTANTACKRRVADGHFQASHCHSTFVNVAFFTTILLTRCQESTYARPIHRHCPWGEEWFHVGGWPFRPGEYTFLTQQNGPPSMIREVHAIYLQGKAVWSIFRKRGESLYTYHQWMTSVSTDRGCLFSW
jgi:hypothetical protein